MILGIYFILSALLATVSFLFRRGIVSSISLFVFLGVQTLLTIYAFANAGQHELTYFLFDNAGLLFLGILCILSYYTVFYSMLYLKRNKDSLARSSIYCTALIMLIMSVTGAYLSEHAGLLWVFIEATTLSVSLLIYHERNALSLEATWKYVFICSIGIALAFVGIIFLGMAMQKNGMYDLSFAAISANAVNANPFWLKMVFLFILVGFSTKTGLFPLQTIKVDALTVAPSPIGAFISAALMNTGFIALYRFYTALSVPGISEWMSNLLMWSGMLSVLIAAVYMMFAGNVKRLAAYSGMEHIGLVAVGLSVGGPVLYAVFLHLILHSFVKAGLFFHMGSVFHRFQTMKIAKIRDYFGKAPGAALVFLMLILFIGGVPPSGLFVSEYLIFRGLFVAGHFWEMAFLLILLTIILFAFVRNALNMVFATDTNPPVNGGKIQLYEFIPLVFLLLAVIWLAYFPPMGVTDFIQQCYLVVH
jgi:hydrogenase-4 component F